MTNKKKIIGIFGFIGSIIVVFLIYVAVQKQQYKIALLKEGIRTEAQIINIIDETTRGVAKGRKSKSTKHYLELALFEQNENPQEIKQNTENNTPTNGAALVDDLFERIGTKPTPVGDYTKVRVLVAGENYRGKKIGDWVTFVYLPNEAEEGLLLDQLQ